jgi:hypothetical protein
VAAITSQGIAEGAMEDEMTTSPTIGDDAFNQAQTELAADFWSKFGKWVDRVRAANDRPKAVSRDLVGLKTLMTSDVPLERRREQARVDIELVVDLAALCRKFVKRVLE